MIEKDFDLFVTLPQLGQQYDLAFTSSMVLLLVGRQQLEAIDLIISSYHICLCRPKDAIRAIKKKLNMNVGKNYTSVMYALTVSTSLSPHKSIVRRYCHRLFI